MDPRRRLLDQLLALDEIDSEHLPVVPLDDYFDGNTQEDSIAPNQCGDGRPTLRELHAHFRAVATRADVQGVYVGLHHSWGEALDDDALWPPAENVHILTSAPREIVESWIVGLQADAIAEGWPYGKHAAAPVPAAGYAVQTVFWD